MRLVALSDLSQFAAVNLTSDPGRIAGPKVIPNAAMVRLNWNLPNSKVGHNILYGTYSGAPALSVALANTIFSALTTGANWTALATFLAPQAALASVTLLDVRSSTGVEITSSSAAVPGTGAGVAAPSEIAINVTLRSANRGPSGRGRFYVPGWTSASFGAGEIVIAGAVTALQTWSTSNLFGAINTNIGAMIIALPARAAYTSPITGRQFPARQATSVAVTSLQVRDNHFDSQRRRGLK